MEKQCGCTVTYGDPVTRRDVQVSRLACMVVIWPHRARQEICGTQPQEGDCRQKVWPYTSFPGAYMEKQCGYTVTYGDPACQSQGRAGKKAGVHIVTIARQKLCSWLTKPALCGLSRIAQARRQ